MRRSHRPGDRAPLDGRARPDDESSISAARLGRVLDSLRTSTEVARAEVFAKRGRSRSARLLADGTFAFGTRDEAGWAVRAGDDERSLFFAASGAPDPATAWPRTMRGSSLALPSAERLLPREPWRDPPWLDLPFASESEVRALVSAIERTLHDELPGARLHRVWLEDGASRERLLSTEGADTTRRRRVASLRLEAISGSGESARGAALETTAPGAGRFDPAPLARRLADRLSLDHEGSAPDRDRGEILLAPAVAVPLIVALGGLWLGPGAPGRAEAATDRRGRLAARAVTLVDDPRLPNGLLSAAVDGEGVPTRRHVLIDRGNYLGPRLDWRDAGASEPGAADSGSGGCMQRPSWRHPPALGVSHLYLQPDPEQSPASLLTSLRRGYYLVEARGRARLDARAERFALPVAGWALRDGRATAPIGSAWLTGSVASWLQGVLATARDLSFYPGLGGMVGSPTLSTRGLELRGSAPG